MSYEVFEDKWITLVYKMCKSLDGTIKKKGSGDTTDTTGAPLLLCCVGFQIEKHPLIGEPFNGFITQTILFETYISCSQTLRHFPLWLNSDPKWPLIECRIAITGGEPNARVCAHQCYRCQPHISLASVVNSIEPILRLKSLQQKHCE